MAIRRPSPPRPLGRIDALIEELLRGDGEIERTQRSLSPRCQGCLCFSFGTYRKLALPSDHRAGCREVRSYQTR